METLTKTVYIIALFVQNSIERENINCWCLLEPPLTPGHIALYCIGRATGEKWKAWDLDTSVSDGFLEENVITTLTVSDKSFCLMKCLEVQNCVTFGYSQTGSCDLYSFSLTGKQASLTFQASTLFYKKKGNCETDDGYTYVQHLNLCFKVYTNRISFDGARAACQSEGGDVIVLSSSEKYSYVENFLLDLAPTHSPRYWFGVRQTPGDISDWKWLDNTPLTSAVWDSNEPSMTKEECAITREVGGRLLLLDVMCYETYKYICEIQV